MDIIIEKYNEKDLPKLLAIWNEVVTDGLAFPQDKLETIDSLKTFFASQTHCGIARNRENNDILGLYILHPNNIGRCGHICNASYGVAKTSRGHGIGQKLVEDSLTKAKELGFRIMQFNAVTADNIQANKLYHKLGFKSLGTIPGGFRRDNKYVDINLYYYPLSN